MSHEPLIVSFEDADPTQVEKLGAKGAKLVEDFRLTREIFPGMEEAIAVPDGFILSTEVWRAYHAAGDRLTEELFARILSEFARLERRKGRRFGDRSGRMPLIVAVRGGAPVSLPGALATILNVGLNEDVVHAMIDGGEDQAFALTTYLTAIRMYGEVVLGIDYDRFYEILMRNAAGGEGTFSVSLLDKLIPAFHRLLLANSHPPFASGFEFHLDRQLRNAISAVLNSWMSTIAIEARQSRQSEHGGIAEEMGTAVVIQEMVFGNRDDTNCLSGVLFTRDQRTGADTPIIEWAPKVQCDKIVSGRLRKKRFYTADLKEQFPDIFERLLLVKEGFEAQAKRPLDIEFTVENRKLYILQRRPMRMTSNATVRSMWDFIDAGKTNIQLASMVINKALEQPEKVLRDGFQDYTVLARGEPITDSADSGILVFGSEAALELAHKGERVILLRKRPYGETDVAVNHPMIRGIIRCDGNTTGHEAVSAVSYSKPYLINTVDAQGRPLIRSTGEALALNPESVIFQYIGRQVFVDGERGILAYTDSEDFLEDRRSRKKLYVDWEFLREQFDASGYHECDYDTLLGIHYQWEQDLEHYQQMERLLREGAEVPQKELLNAFGTCLRYFPERDVERALHLKEVRVEDFVFGPPLVYYGHQLEKEVFKILRTLMLCTTWCTHWVHEIMVHKSRERGETENDVIRDIFLKNRTMKMLREFEAEGFHVMRMPNRYCLILASNFEYSQDLDQLQIGPGALNYKEKEVLARKFMGYLQEVNPELHSRVRMMRGEPPLGQGHARIISIGISMRREDFDLLCRYLRTFLDQAKSGDGDNWLSKIPIEEFVEIYTLDPYFAPFPEIRITQEAAGGELTGDCLLSLGNCSYGEFDGMVYGRDDYEGLMDRVKAFEAYLATTGRQIPIRPWHFEVDPFRRHSVIAAVGFRFNRDQYPQIVEKLKGFLKEAPPAH